MPRIFGVDYIPLIARVAHSRSRPGQLIAKLSVQGMQQLAFFEEGASRGLRAGDEVEVMITRPLHPRGPKGRLDRTRLTALMIQPISERQHVLMAIEGFRKASRNELVTSLAIASDGYALTEAAMNLAMDMASRFPLSGTISTPRTRVLTPGRTEAFYVDDTSRGYAERRFDEAEPTNVWVSTSRLHSPGRRPIEILGLTCTEDLACADRFFGEPLAQAA